MPTVKELTDELRRLGGTGYSGKKKAELEVMLAEVKQFWASRKAPAPAADAPKKAAEAAPAPPSAHAESMAKKAKPAKTGAISTPLSALAAGPAKRSLAEEKAELEKEILEFEGKIKKYESKKDKARKRIKEIDHEFSKKEVSKLLLPGAIDNITLYDGGKTIKGKAILKVIIDELEKLKILNDKGKLVRDGTKRPMPLYDRPEATDEANYYGYPSKTPPHSSLINLMIILNNRAGAGGFRTESKTFRTHYGIGRDKVLYLKDAEDIFPDSVLKESIAVTSLRDRFDDIFFHCEQLYYITYDRNISPNLAALKELLAE